MEEGTVIAIAAAIVVSLGLLLLPDGIRHLRTVTQWTAKDPPRSH